MLKKLELWEQHMEAFNSSELSAKEWCEEHEIKVSTFNYWKKKICAQDTEEETIFAEISPFKSCITVGEPVSLCITWNQCQIKITSHEEAELAATFFYQLQELC